MAVIQIVTDTGTTLVTTSGVEHLVGGVPANVAVVEVLTGLPGVTNLVVSSTTPSNPFENLVWIVI